MATTKPGAEATLVLARTFAAPREQVFRAWTEPEELKKWWAAGPGFTTPIAEVDLRIGGRYRLGMKPPDKGRWRGGRDDSRRSLPLGGPVKEDYVFEEGGPDFEDLEARNPVRFSGLFREGKDSLILCSFMYGPQMQRPCPSCTSILDGLNGSLVHALQRINFAVVAKSPIQRIRAFALERGWRNLRLLSSALNTYNADYHGEEADGGQISALNVFVRREGKIYHFYNTELLYAQSNPGQDPRHVDPIWPLWNLFDLTPEGRGSKWNPRLAYTEA